ncbi:MAG: hypothetical protein EOP04_07960 [Proteobacteria bacterium]|nr:MAG: hypothetical protein EOP04_07960 [Pseudomonadota bacterium]
MKNILFALTAGLLAISNQAFAGAATGGTGRSIDDWKFKEIARESIEGSQIYIDGNAYDTSHIDMEERAIGLTNSETGDQIKVYSNLGTSSRLRKVPGARSERYQR